MLAHLSIRDVVLIDQLDLALESGFSALTGETGAGKSILLDALGLALGGRGDARLVRQGAAEAVVSASFDVAAEHPANNLLKERGVDAENTIVVRRVLGKDGRGRSFINDQPATTALLRELGMLLVEVQGQSEQHGLADAAAHRAALDAHGGLAEKAAAAASAFHDWVAARDARDAHAARASAAATDADYLRHALAELEALDPKPGEEETLSAERQVLMQRERLAEALGAATAALGGARSVDAVLRNARRQLERAAAKTGSLLEPVLAAIDRADIELGEALKQLNAIATTLDSATNRLQVVDDRLFALRDVARKHRVGLEALPPLRRDIAMRLAAIANDGETAASLETRAGAARTAYEARAAALSSGRRAAATSLDKAIAKELPPLKLEKARFSTRIEMMPESEWSPAGADRIVFEVSTNPGSPLAAIGRIASGGELARFLLALKVATARSGPAPTLIFDEVDSGIGGATAAAVGERLSRLGRTLQILAVTHSPQVAARADQHWRISKQARPAGKVATRAETLVGDMRREEIARMLAGASITDEARRAAEVLMIGVR